MTKRREPFYIDEHYHVFNRGIDKRTIFLDKGDLYYFFDTMQISNTKNLLASTQRNQSRLILKQKINSDNIVNIISYCLLPNHFHIILEEIEDGGISKFMSRLNGSYVKYFNAKYKRSGTLFEGRFKANRITGAGTNEMSLELTSAYVNLNYKHHNYDIKKDLIKSSVFEYLGTELGDKICNQEEIQNIINSIGGLEEYKEWLKNQSEYFTEKHNNDISKIDFDELEK